MANASTVRFAERKWHREGRRDWAGGTNVLDSAHGRNLGALMVLTRTSDLMTSLPALRVQQIAKSGKAQRDGGCGTGRARAIAGGAVVRGHVTVDGIPGFLGEAYDEVIRTHHAQGQKPAGPPFGRYERTESGFFVVAGFPYPRSYHRGRPGRG